MEDYSDYRETPNTGRTPKYSEHELEPSYVDPSLLTDDRPNPELFAFEKTWGHRVLAGISVAMIAIAVILIAFCIVQIVRISDVLDVLPLAAFNMYLYVGGLIAGIVLIPPACIGIYVAKHPKKAMLAIAIAIVALVLVVLFFCYAMSVTPAFLVTAILYSALLAIIPIIYLIAALKIKRSS